MGGGREIEKRRRYIREDWIKKGKGEWGCERDGGEGNDGKEEGIGKICEIWRR